MPPSCSICGASIALEGEPHRCDAIVEAANRLGHVAVKFLGRLPPQELENRLRAMERAAAGIGVVPPSVVAMVIGPGRGGSDLVSASCGTTSGLHEELARTFRGGERVRIVREG